MTNTDDRSRLEASKEALRAAAEDCGEPLSRNDYRSWRAAQDDVLITSATIIEQVGNGEGWVVACKALGIAAPFTESHYTSKNLKIAVKEAAEAMGEPLTVQQYEQWRSEQVGEPPSSGAIATYLGGGSWSEAVLFVGGTPGEKGGSRWDESDARESLKLVADECDGLLTVEKYRSWRSEQDQKHPSKSTIVNKLGDGSWVDALDTLGLQAGNVPTDE